MSESEERLEPTEIIKNESAVVLGCWDYEKTPNLIQDLEHSVNLVELKCKNLLEELTHYKKYLEKPGEVGFHLAVFKKNKKAKAAVFFSESEPEITFRKNRIHFEKIKHKFEEQFKGKLKNVNREIEEAAQKIGLKGSIILLSVNDYLKAISEQLEDREQFEVDEEEEEDIEEEEEMRKKFIKLSTLKNKAKSDSLIANYDKDLDFSRITKNQLAIYQKLSRLSMKKKYRKLELTRTRKLEFRRKKVKFSFNKKTQKYRHGFRTFRSRLKIPKSCKKTLKKVKRAILLEKRSSLPRQSGSTMQTQDMKIHQPSVHAVQKDLNKSREDVRENEKEIEACLGAALRKVMPFTACASTSRSYNIGLNMQQLLSLSKYRRSNLRISASEKIRGDEKPKNIGSLNLNQGVVKVKKMHSSPWNHFQRKNNGFDIGEKRGNAIVPGLVSNYRKVRSKTTETSPDGVFKYRKSTTSQFTTAQQSMIQSQSKTAYAIGSKIMVSDCQRTYEIEKRNGFNNAFGDGKGNNNKSADVYMEWAKVYNFFLKICRKFACLKEKVLSSDSACTNEELKSLEKDIDYSIAKYKEFLEFYTKFLHLNHRLKSLKIACETKTFEPGASFTSNCQTKIWGNKQTHSMAMKNAFREVQALQAKINLVND